MCGRYAASANPDELIEEFEVDVDGTGEPSRSTLVNPQDPPAGTPDYNMAPAKLAPVVLTRPPRGQDDAEPLRQLRLLSWGLVPSWAKDPKVGMRMINARLESALEKPAFKKAALSRRAIVPARGWYEWQASPVARDGKGKPRKQPFFLTREDGDVVAFAGLYEFWRDRAVDPTDPAAWLVSFTILTTEAEPGLDRIHDRQPVVLDRDRWADWLDPTATDPDAVRTLAQSPGAGRFVTWPVGTAVNATRNNGAALLEPVSPESLDGVVDPTTGEVLGA
ncbi:SOS response-associated peptidase [Ornithinicoccus hortensis]|uniref:Abasic site processing protein n=1 Tax=Ornithinicoccus hortensis TaxID=82346 RepID=A0A542YQ12_9MICO|nr:SOS response-associated peptidase [Ornithinicoccus hortensis]TQL50192.1 putative SOS response-associated peptidase YedK [Ornithinicoccus hortensis]